MKSYVNLTEAEEYFSSRLYSEKWDNADEGEKQKALITATESIDRQLLKGRKANLSQNLAFPRYPDTNIPIEVKKACLEEAYALLERGNSSRAKLQREGVTSFRLGDLSETYKDGAGVGLLSQKARDLLKPWIAGAVRIR